MARLELGRKTARQIVAGLSDSSTTGTANPRQHHSGLNVRTVGWAIGVASRYVPWRADCLVQAMAAHRWLRDYGHKTSLSLGVAIEENGLAAHAWLQCEDIIVTGGNSASRYTALPMSPP
jgi:hypothetical protein